MKKVKVFMLHFAGGNKYSFRFLQDKLDNYETIPLELPGRGSRFGEPLIYDAKSAVKDIYYQIKQHLVAEDIFIIYGHSMGAKLGFHVIHELEKEGLWPKCFIATGNAGPGLPRDKIRYKLPDNEFVVELKKLGGTPTEFFDNEELYKLFSPIMRADFQIVEAEDEKVDFKIKTSLFVLMGDQEEMVSNITNWAKYAEEFQFKLLPGDHFFIYNHSVEITHIITNCANN
ncbi:MAG: thioesterase domain-containing protein [Bacteroidetes bacterium]|nr:thioesterase domain-containing protein [Bacteroidota bacterium]